MKVNSRAITATEAMEYLPMTNAFAYKIGQGLVITSGAAVLVGATAVPSHICVSEVTGVTGGFVQAVRILPDMTLEANFSAAGTAINAGDKVTIAADGINVTATIASGVATVVDFPDGTKASGDRVLIRF
jgi:hypothetical protein